MLSIETPEKKDLKQLAEIYKEVFAEHNVFTDTDENIIKYLENVDGDFLVAKENGKVIGGCLLVSVINKNKHSLWRIKHFAITKSAQKKGAGTELMMEIDKMIRKQISKGEFKSAKIEIHVSESEKDSLKFYKKQNYEIEGKLKSHYRKGKTCYIVGKSM